MTIDYIFNKAQELYDNKEYVQALELYEEAAGRGSADAMFALGVVYLTGDGVSIDVELAKRYIAKAKKLNHPVAMFYLDIIEDYSQEDFDAAEADY